MGGQLLRRGHRYLAGGDAHPAAAPVHRRGVDQEKLDFLLANLRGPAEREGDILAQMAATRAAERRGWCACARSTALPRSATH